MIEIKTTIKFLPETIVEAKNYRKKPEVWERGEVAQLDIRVYPDGRTRNVYLVRLMRKPPKGGYIFLTVGDDKVREAHD